MANEHLRWVARGVFQTTEGAPIPPGGSLGDHLLAVTGQQPIEPQAAPVVAEAPAAEATHGDAREEIEQPVGELSEEASDQADAEVEAEVEPAHDVESTTAIGVSEEGVPLHPDLAFEVFGTLQTTEEIKAEAVPPRKLTKPVVKKQPAKKKSSSK